MSTYLFIDGAYFREAYATTMARFFGEVPTINYRDLLGQLFGGHSRIYWYDAVDRGRVANETEVEQAARVKAQDDFHAYLNSLNNWHVREGFVSRGRRASRRTQKAVDVQLAVDALEHAVARNMTQATFVFGDLDFEPLLFSLNRFGINTTLWYERATASPELLEAADERRQFSIQLFHGIAEGTFKGAHPTPSFGQSSNKPDFPVVRTGAWESRPIELLQLRTTPYYLFLWVDAGEDPVRQPNLYCHYPLADPAKVELAFVMHYGGEIVWEQPPPA